ncbi:MAG: cytochrome P450 family protein [Thermoanaerobaculia bacterium]
MNPDLTSAAFRADPFPFYARLRRESPVHEVTLAGRRVWLVTRYNDVLALLKDERFVKSPAGVITPDKTYREPWMPAMFRPLSRNMLDLDPPDHTRLRSIVQKGFTPRFVELLRGRVEAIADELLVAMRQRRRMDVIADFALPLPTIVIAEMLGVPAGQQHRFHRWSQAIVAANWSKWSMVRAVPAVFAFIRYIRRLIALKRQHPADDLITALVGARESEDRLSDDELLSMIFLLLIAGHETTVNLIGNGTLALLQHPAEMQRLRDDTSIVGPAIEELLRFGSPLETATERYAREALTFAGAALPAGALVYAVLASANRDEAVFPDPDRLDLARDPNRHLSFGLGIHYCLGAPLARMEGQIAIPALLRAFPEMRLTNAPLRWRRGMVLRGLEALPVT